VFQDILFICSAILVIAGTLGVVFSKNLMRACTLLLGTLFGVAGLYAVLGADFLAASQLVIYAGGVIILMLFAVMLTGGSADKANKFGIEKIMGMGSVKTYVIAGLTVLVFSLTIMKLLASFLKGYQKLDELPAFTSTVDKIGTMLVTDHVLAFEISSILLLGALVGAAVIARPRRG
tara:strand:+ start:1236 stop:1766 length:531 start_codon:yes stop_codon:yes gene_type:complete